MFYVNAKYLARRMKIEEFVVQQTTNWTFLKKKCQAWRGEIPSHILFLYVFKIAVIWEAGQPGLPESRRIKNEARSRLPRFIHA